MTIVRSPAVAGTFYPADANTLHAVVTDYLNQAQAFTGQSPKAIIAPHAGYIYSGPIAATAYNRLAADHNIIKRIVLLGPAHRVPFTGLAASNADAFSTPLGDVPIDKESIAKITVLSQAQVFDDAHTQEHSLEVHLPFLQEVLDDFMLVPLVVGDATAEQVAEVLEMLWGGPETRIVISSDLSHYHDYDTAQQLDSTTSKAIETLSPDKISYDHACGRIPVNGLLLAARTHGLKASTIDLRNSGDTAGSGDQVVGYGAYIFE